MGVVVRRAIQGNEMKIGDYGVRFDYLPMLERQRREIKREKMAGEMGSWRDREERLRAGVEWSSYKSQGVSQRISKIGGILSFILIIGGKH